jgi:hypothetical protein
MMNELFQKEYAAGDTITTEAGVKITPFARIIKLRIPGIKGGLIWNRPASLLVEENGEERVLSIPDPTRTAQWMLLGSTLLMPLAVWLLLRRRSL